MKICLDAGHAKGQNQSPAVAAYDEGDRMFVLQGYLKQALEHYGIDVICTKTAVGQDPTPYERGTKAKGCDLFLSLHTNAVGTGKNDTVDYVRIYYPVTRRGQTLAQELSEVIASVMTTAQQPQFSVRWNAARTADYFGVIRHSVSVGVPGMVLAHSFHTNTRTANWLLNDENLRKLATAEAAVIAEHYGSEDPEMRYEFLKDVKNEFYRPTIDKLIEKHIIEGKGGEGEQLILDLGEDAVRLLTMLDRAGVFGD